MGRSRQPMRCMVTGIAPAIVDRALDKDIIDARVESFNDGQISIRIVTTGGIPMGPLERAVSSLTRGEARISQES